MCPICRLFGAELINHCWKWDARQERPLPALARLLRMMSFLPLVHQRTGRGWFNTKKNVGSWTEICSTKWMGLGTQITGLWQAPGRPSELFFPSANFVWNLSYYRNLPPEVSTSSAFWFVSEQVRLAQQLPRQEHATFIACGCISCCLTRVFQADVVANITALFLKLPAWFCCRPQGGCQAAFF